MSAEDDLLARELGKVGALAGKVGGKLSGVSHGEMANEAAARLGASLAARFLPTERFRKEIQLRTTPQLALSKVYAVLASKGTIVDPQELKDSPLPTLAAVIKSGFLNMNPTVIYAEVIGAEGDTCTLALTGAAKEGLIKQRSAEKAVARLAAAIGRPV
jgi:hypothetical protein